MRYQILVQFHGVYNIDIDGVYREKNKPKCKWACCYGNKITFFSSYKPRGIKVKLQQEGPTQNWHFYFLQLAKVESMCISQCFWMDVGVALSGQKT